MLKDPRPLTNKKKKKREELSLKQKTYIGIAVFVLLVVLTLRVVVPQYTLMQARGMADRINEIITEDEFELVEAERSGLSFFSRFQSTRYKDLYISTDVAPADLTAARIEFLYERAVREKPGTILRFAMGTDDALYDQLRPKLGNALLRVIGEFAGGSSEELALDEPFRLGRLRTYTPTVDILAQADDDTYLMYFEKIMEKLDQADYGHTGLNIQFTADRKTSVTYLWQADPGSDKTPAQQVREDLARISSGQSAQNFSIARGVYYDYPYNHDFTLPAQP